MAQIDIAPQLTNLQLELLKVYARQVSDEDIKAIKKMLAQYFANKAMDLADQAWEKNGWQTKDTERLMVEHNRISHESRH